LNETENRLSNVQGTTCSNICLLTSCSGDHFSGK